MKSSILTSSAHPIFPPSLTLSHLSTIPVSLSSPSYKCILLSHFLQKRSFGTARSGGVLPSISMTQAGTSSRSGARGEGPRRIRHITRSLKHKRDEQLKRVSGIIEQALQNQDTFVEVNEVDEDTRWPSTMPLSGTAIAVSDSLDVVGFTSHYNVATKKLHRVPRKSHPFIAWLQQQGACVAGKLKGHTPLNFEEASVLKTKEKDLQIAKALNNRCCDYVICNSFVGAAGMAASIGNDICCFKPSGGTIQVDDARFDSTCGSIAIAAHHLDDIVYLWQSYTGTLQTIERNYLLQQNQRSTSTFSNPTPQINGVRNSLFGSVSSIFTSRNIKQENDKLTSTASNSDSKEEPKATGFTNISYLSSLRISMINAWNIICSSKTSLPSIRRTAYTPAPYDPRNHLYSPTSSYRADHEYHSLWQQRREGVLKVGFPSTWIDAHGGRMMKAVDFEVHLKGLYEQNKIRAQKGNGQMSTSGGDGANTKDEDSDEDEVQSLTGKTNRIEFLSINININLNELFRHITLKSHYEIAQHILKKDDDMTPSDLDIDTALAPVTKGSKRPSSLALLDELPSTIVSAVFEGKKITTEENRKQNQLWTEHISRLIGDVFVDVDMICCPITCRPYASENSRSILFQHPFVLNGNPMLSLKLDKELSVMLVGEIGRGSQFLEDAVRFSKFIKVEPVGRSWLRTLW